MKARHIFKAVGTGALDGPHHVIAKIFVKDPTPQIPQLRIALRVRLRAAPFAQDDIAKLAFPYGFDYAPSYGKSGVQKHAAEN